VVAFLLLFHLKKLVGKLEHLSLRIHEPVLLVLYALVNEAECHLLHVLASAPQNMKNLVSVIGELVLGAANYAEVWLSLFGQADGNLHFDVAVVIVGVLHQF
jgi:hypothetical protein